MRLTLSMSFRQSVVVLKTSCRVNSSGSGGGVGEFNLHSAELKQIVFIKL